MAEDFEKIAATQLPRDPQGNPSVDLYVYMPSSQRYIRWLVAGDVLTDDKLALLAQHPVPEIFIKPVKHDTVISGEAPPPTEVKHFSGPGLTVENIKVEVIGKEAEKDLKQIFTMLMDANADPTAVLKILEEKTDHIVNLIAPETKQLRSHLINNLRYVNLMNDSSAITSMAIMVAMASGYDSKKSYRDLAYACLVMDASMTEFTPEEIDQYYKDRDQLPPETLARMHKHPLRSHQIALEKMKSLSDVTLQLILSHHEFFSGKGFPRGQRSESLFPMVKVLALAVDLFEHMRKAELNGQALSLAEAMLLMREDKVEPHLRRHSKKLVDQVVKFLELDKAATPA